jgi:hypothetical protein
MGHSDMNTTNRYPGVKDKSKIDAVRDVSFRKQKIEVD